MMKQKCQICGMLIHNKNYKLNAMTYTATNSEKHIVRCPFCGVTATYIGQGDLAIGVPSDLTKEQIKILEMAMKLEVFNGQFYENASNMAEADELKKLFAELSKIEWMHARVHKLYGGFNQLPELRIPDYTRHNTDSLLLREAHKREKHAITFYNRYYHKVPEVIQRVFDSLMAVEQEHIAVIEVG